MVSGGVNMGLRFPDKESYETVQAILAYESAVRGCPAGRALVELVMEGADFGLYPEEVRERLREIAGRAAHGSMGSINGLGNEA